MMKHMALAIWLFSFPLMMTGCGEAESNPTLQVPSTPDISGEMREMEGEFEDAEKEMLADLDDLSQKVKPQDSITPAQPTAAEKNQQPGADVIAAGPPPDSPDPQRPPSVSSKWQRSVDELVKQLEGGSPKNWSSSELYFLVDVADFVAMDGDYDRVDRLISLAKLAQEGRVQDDLLLAELHVAHAIAFAKQGTLRLTKVDDISPVRLKADGLRRIAVAFAERGDAENAEKVIERLGQLTDATKDWRDRYAAYGNLGRLYGQLGREREAHAIGEKLGQIAQVAREAGAERQDILAAEREALAMIPLGLCEGSCFAAARSELAMYAVVGLSTDGPYYEMAERQAQALDFESAAGSALKISDDFLRAKALQVVLQQALSLDEILPQVIERLTELTMREAVKVRSNAVSFDELKSMAMANSVRWGVNDSIEGYLESAQPHHQIRVLAAMIRRAYEDKARDDVRQLSKRALQVCNLIESEERKRQALELVGEVMGECGVDSIVLEVETGKGFHRACGLFGIANGQKLDSAMDLVRFGSDFGVLYVGRDGGETWKFGENPAWKAFYASLKQGDSSFVRSSYESEKGQAIAVATANGFDLAARADRDGVIGIQSLIENGNFNESQRIVLNQLLYSSPGTIESRSGLRFTKRLAVQPQNWFVISIVKN